MLFDAGKLTSAATPVTETVTLTRLSAVIPDLVVVKSDQGTYPHWRVAAHTTSHRMGDAATRALGIQDLTTAGQFDIGTSPDVQGASDDLHWFALYDDGNGDFATGTYTGDGGTTQSIDTGLGAALECVWILSDDSDEDHWHSLSMGGTTDASFQWPGGTAALPQTDAITDIATTTGTFVVGQTRGNINTQVYRWFAWASTAGIIDSVSYTGDGNDNHVVDIDPNNQGNTPEFVHIRKATTTAGDGYWRFTTSGGAGHSGNDSSRDDSGADSAIGIKALGSEQITLGTSNFVNTDTETYHAFWFLNNPVSAGPSPLVLYTSPGLSVTNP